MTPLFAHNLDSFRQLTKLRGWLLPGIMAAMLLFSSLVSASHIHEGPDCGTAIQVEVCDSTDNRESSKPVSDHFCLGCQLGDLKLSDGHAIPYIASTDANTFRVNTRATSPRGPPAKQHPARAPPTVS